MGELRQEFLKKTIFNLETLQNEFAADSLDEDFLRRYFRCLHTIKGTANTFSLFDLARIAHKIEDLVQALQNNQIQPNNGTTAVFRESFTQILQTARDYQDGAEIFLSNEFTEKLKSLIPDQTETNDLLIFQIPSEFFQGSPSKKKDALNLAIQKAKLLSAESYFKIVTFYEDFKNFKEILNQNGEVIAVASDTNRNPQQEVNFQFFFVSDLEKETLEKLIDNFSVQINFENLSPTKELPNDLAEVLQNLVNYGKKTAQFLNKNISFETNFDEAEISAKHLILLNEVASHLLHNAIDHAIEPLEKRTSDGKNATAKIKLSFKNLPGELFFEIEDDGCGIDVKKIIHVAKEKGIIENNGTATEKEALQLIFLKVFSTSHTVSEISGRGVGLDAVKDLVEKSGGRIEVETKDGFGSTFSVYLPKN